MNKGLSALLLAAVTAFLLFSPLEICSPVDRQLCGRVMDASHLPYFALLTFLTHRFFRLPLTSTFVLMVALAIGAELVQPLVGREFSSTDSHNSLFGILLGSLAAVFWKKESSALIRMLVVLFGLITAAAALYPAKKQWEARAWQKNVFPLLADFEHEEEALLWKPHQNSSGATPATRSQKHSARGDWALEVSTRDNLSWEGVEYNARDRDWSTFETLVFDVYNSGEPFELGVRIDDDGDVTEYNQRYSDWFKIAAGTNTIRIPLEAIKNAPQERALNMKSIRRVLIYTGKDKPAQNFYIDWMRLE